MKLLKDTSMVKAVPDNNISHPKCVSLGYGVLIEINLETFATGETKLDSTFLIANSFWREWEIYRLNSLLN